MSPTIKIGLLLFAALLSESAAFAGSGFKLLTLDGAQVRWPAGSRGAVITYRVAIGSSSARGVDNCRSTAGLRSLLKRSFLHEGEFEESLRRAMRLWSDAANVQFVQAAPDASANLIIAAEGVPDGVAFTDVTHTSTTITGAIVCLNPELRWTAGETSEEASYRLYYVLAHEIGHALGLDHPSPDGELMSFEYSRSLQGLQRGDIAGIRSLYGAERTETANVMQR